MKNRITVTIADRSYTMVATEDEAYVRRCAAHVDAKLRETAGDRLGQVDAAVLAAMNITDQYFKALEDAENLRRQYKESLEEASRLKLELSEKNREIFRLQNKK